MDNKLRIGTLGAAKITPMALIYPARNIDAIEVVAVAARNPVRAKKFARRHGIPQVFSSYEELIQSDTIDAVYNPLPNSHHAYWSIRAMQAGKHVLCEKPIAANTQEAQRMQQAAQQHKRILMEAFHWRYHPLANRLVELVQTGSIGEVQNIDATFCIPLPFSGDIRYNPVLAGGALMDTGCYTVSIVRQLMQAEPQVLSATATKASETIDRFMEAQLLFPSGAKASIRCSLWGWPLLSVKANVYGTQGSIHVFNPVAPHILYHHLKINSSSLTRTERFRGTSTYACQLTAFHQAIEQGISLPTDAADAIRNMEVIDAIYRQAGMQPRTGYWPS